MHATIRSGDQLDRQGLEQRSQARSEVALPILIALDWTRYSALLHNLSRNGAMIETTAPLLMHNKIEFHCGSICTSGSVLWQGESTFGIKFSHRISDRQLSEQVLRSEALAGRRLSRAIALDGNSLRY